MSAPGPGLCSACAPFSPHSSLGHGHRCPHVLDKSAEAQGGGRDWPEIPSWGVARGSLNPGVSGLRTHFLPVKDGPWHLTPLVFLDPSLEDMCGTECAPLGEDGQRPPRCTSTTSSQSEPSEQLRHHQGKSLASEDPKKKRAQKPSHMRRNIR